MRYIKHGNVKVRIQTHTGYNESQWHIHLCEHGFFHVVTWI